MVYVRGLHGCAGDAWAVVTVGQLLFLGVLIAIGLQLWRAADAPPPADLGPAAIAGAHERAVSR
jgi:hypothetical protein